MPRKLYHIFILVYACQLVIYIQLAHVINYYICIKSSELIMKQNMSIMTQRYKSVDLNAYNI